MKASTRHKTIGLVVVAAVVSGCAMSPSATTSPGQSQTEAASPGQALNLVALGDSVAVSQACECARFPDLYGELASPALGQPVVVQNRAVSGTTSSDLLETLESSPQLRSFIEEADIITITIGINDLGPCGDESDLACYEGAIASVRTNLDSIHSEIDALQGDHPHVLRQTAYYNLVIGGPDFDDRGPAFQTFYADQLAALNNVICEAVTGHAGLCVDLLTAFNGPAGDQDAGSLLSADHVHPSRTGHETIAHELDALGYAPLAP